MMFLDFTTYEIVFKLGQTNSVHNTEIVLLELLYLSLFGPKAFNFGLIQFCH
jgi:hypothetical protein